MPGAPISRWTMSYFFAALAFLMSGLVLMTTGFGFVSEGAVTPDTLVLVHVVALGWLGLLFCGALLQFVPVLAATSLKFPKAAAPSLMIFIVGLLCLLGGFLSLGGHLDVSAEMLPLGAALIAIALGMLGVCFGVTILTRGPVVLAARLVLLGLCALWLTALMGSTFSLSLSGRLDAGWVNFASAYGVQVHAASGVLGALTAISIGVSYRLFPMFMLSPEKGLSERSVLLSAAGALALLYVSPFAEFAAPFAGEVVAVASLGLAALAALTYVGDLLAMARLRKRSALELNVKAGMSSVVFLLLGMGMLVASELGLSDNAVGPAAYYALAMGWLTPLGLAQLYKIIPFLTWLETYGPVMGKHPVPRVQDLVREKAAYLSFAGYYSAVCCGTSAVLMDWPFLFRFSAFAQSAALLVLAVEFIRARKLSYAPDHLRLPSGAVLPNLFYANPQ